MRAAEEREVDFSVTRTGVLPHPAAKRLVTTILAFVLGAAIYLLVQLVLPPPAPKFGVPVLVARSSNVNLVAVLYRNGGGALASDTYTVTVRDPGRESILATIAINTEKPERDIKIGWSGAREVFVAAPKGEWLMQNPAVSISEGKVFARFMGRANVEEEGQK